MKFKVGDRVVKYKLADIGDNEVPVGTTGTIIELNWNGYDYHIDYGGDYINSYGGDKWLKLAKPPKFILQYRTDIEEFQTLAEIKKRIKELAKESGYLFRIYEIKKIIIPTEVISIKGL